MRIEENDVIQFTVHKTCNYIFVLFLNNLYLVLVMYVNIELCMVVYVIFCLYLVKYI